MDISLSNICKTYDDNGRNRLIFVNMTTTFAPGEFSVVMGKSGVGKSSLLNLISGIDVPDKGDIQLGGTVLSKMNDTDRTRFRRRHIGFIHQFFNLIPVLTVLENVTLISLLDGVPEKTAVQTGMKLLEKVGLHHRHQDMPDRLSGGEQQRVAIVRALVNSPDVILADEPTGNLDGETGRKILDLIAGLTKQDGKTLVMATHSPESNEYPDTDKNLPAP